MRKQVKGKVPLQECEGLNRGKGRKPTRE